VNRSRQTGVTLLEMLVSVAIMGVIASLIYTTFAETLSTRRYVEQRAQTFATARTAMDWLERDLRGAFEVAIYESDKPRFISAGHAGTDTLTRDAPLLDISAVTARGTTLLAKGASISDEAEDRGDQARIVYRLEREKSSKVLLEAELEAEQGLALVRYELRPALSTDPETGSRSIIARGIRSVDLSFSDGTTEYESWDSAIRSGSRSGAPRTVEIRLVIIEPEGEDTEFISGVLLPFGVRRG
jgi:prepilin-type N-terminal cleavage/methylation domain-containing protein